jgi:hypothetical protein
VPGSDKLRSLLARLGRLQEKLRPQIERDLDAGEKIEAIIPATGRDPTNDALKWTAGVLGVFASATEEHPSYRPTNPVIVATDRRILVYGRGKFRWSRLQGRIAELQRDAKIGPMDHDRLWTASTIHMYPPLYINWRSYPDVAAADESAARRDPQPPTTTGT